MQHLSAQFLGIKNQQRHPNEPDEESGAQSEPGMFGLMSEEDELWMNESEEEERMA